MKLYLLRVGADSTEVGGGFHSRIFENRSFMFIPILAKKEKLILNKTIAYKDFKWRKKSIVPYLPHKTSPDEFVHNDPEFVTFTYGSPKYNSQGRKDKNYDAILNMKKDDILVFYAAFCSEDTNMNGLYFFAYFVVDYVPIAWGDPNNLGQEKQYLVRNNHHFIHKQLDQIVIVGNRDRSKVFEKAIPLSLSNVDRKGSNYYPCLSVYENLGGYCKSMNLSSLRTLTGEVGSGFKEYLDRG